MKKANPMAARNLEALADRLNKLDRDDLRDIDLAALPVFGRREVNYTSEVWSWDETHILVSGNCGFEIQPRCGKCGEAMFHCGH